MFDDNHPGGICFHKDYTDATGDGSHWDVGFNYPVDVFDQDMADYMSGDGFLMALSDNQQQQMYDVMADCAEVTGGVTLGTAVGELYNWLKQSGVPLHSGEGGNAILSTYKGVFFKTPSDPADPETSTPVYGPAVNHQLAEIRTAIGELPPGSGTPVDLDELAVKTADEMDRRARDNNPTTGPVTTT